MSNDFVMKVGESLLGGGPPGTAAEPEVIIGELNGPFGAAFATLLGNQIKGHTKVLALMNTDVMVKPATIMVSKVTVKAAINLSKLALSANKVWIPRRHSPKAAQRAHPACAEFFRMAPL